MKNNFLNFILFSGVLFAGFLPVQNSFADTVDVQIIKSAFVPPVVKIKKGDTVRWTNTEELLHTVTSGKAPEADGAFNGDYVLKEYKTIPTGTGVIDYFCALHNATMRGVIVVEENPPSKPAR